GRNERPYLHVDFPVTQITCFNHACLRDVTVKSLLPAPLKPPVEADVSVRGHTDSLIDELS
ncbi:hypothetical protein ACWD4T_51900, partial [Streptomyces umbrinus]